MKQPSIKEFVLFTNKKIEEKEGKKWRKINSPQKIPKINLGKLQSWKYFLAYAICKKDFTKPLRLMTKNGKHQKELMIKELLLLPKW